MRELSGRVAVITGGASGVGRATADLLASRGSHLALVDVNEERLLDAARELGASGVNVSTHVVDVADPEQMAALPAAVVVEHGAAACLGRGLWVLSSSEHR